MLPVTEIAYASGFTSLRRFNDVFSQQYRMPPTRLRKTAREQGEPINSETSTLFLSYRPPFNWTALLSFLRVRAIKGVERVDQTSYVRTVRLGECTGWIRVTQANNKPGLNVTFTHSLMPVLPALLHRLRMLFDLNTHPDLIAAHLQQEPLLMASLQKDPGLRMPGAFDGFEIVVRTILGQQITVNAATTLAGRFANAFGDPVQTPFPELTRLSPLPARVARATLDEMTDLDIVSTRSRTLLAIAQSYQRGEFKLDATTAPEAVINALMALPGIGESTAQNIVMRALHWPDAFPSDDSVVRKNLGKVTAKEAESLSKNWRPWRSYALMHIWKKLAQD